MSYWKNCHYFYAAMAVMILGTLRGPEIIESVSFGVWRAANTPGKELHQTILLFSLVLLTVIYTLIGIWPSISRGAKVFGSPLLYIITALPQFFIALLHIIKALLPTTKHSDHQTKSFEQSEEEENADLE